MTEQATATAEPKITPSENGKQSMPDITGMLEKFKLPGFDLDDFVESRKHDIDAVTAATGAAFAGAQTIVEKQTELLKTVLSEVADVLHTLPQDAAKPAELLRKQRELVTDALSSALTSMKEIAETARKSQSDIFEIASNRLRSNVEAIRKLGAKSTDSDDKTVK